MKRRIELTAMKAGGSEFPVELIVVPAGSGDAPAFTGFIRDLTERRKVERALVRSESRFRRLSEAGILGIITADTQGRIIEANDAFLELAGYTSEEVHSGRVGWVDMTPPEWRFLDERAVEQLGEKGVAVPYEKEYLRKDGTASDPRRRGDARCLEGRVRRVHPGRDRIAGTPSLPSNACARSGRRVSRSQSRRETTSWRWQGTSSRPPLPPC